MMSVAVPSVPLLCECLTDLVEWQVFAQYLPGIRQADIGIIRRDRQGDVIGQKVALYTKWLQVHPNASWDDVVKALENPAVRENTIAQQLREKYLETATQSNYPQSEKVSVSEDIVTELDSMQRSFVDLTRNVRKEVEENVKAGNTDISTIAFMIQQERAFSIDSLKSVKNTGDLFEAIHPHYNFLNCYLIIQIALFLCGIVAKKARAYDKRIKKFMKTTKIRYLRNTLKQYCPQRYRRIPFTTVVEIEVENGWGHQPLWLVRNLIETLFPVKDPDELPWYDIVPGSIVMTFIALEHMTPSLIESSRNKTELMRLLGVISLKIGDEVVWHKRDRDDAVFSFEQGLIQAIVADHFEAAQFILKYTQHININTKNINLRLTDEDVETAYVTKSDCEITLEIFETAFEYMLQNIKNEDSSSTTVAPAIDEPHDNFLNGRILKASMKLPEELAIKVGKYIERIDGSKRVFQVQYLQNKCLSAPFPGSIEVIITLHSVWSGCSVWYVEQLGQLIFTPTLFYQLQWYTVDRQDGSVVVCLLADGKIVDSLKKCFGDNESRTSMLGVISVQIDDTVMVVNDYSDGYTFDEAVKQTKNHHNISNLLQQILLSPVDCKNPSSPYDMNNNFYFMPHLDSTPLIIACCNGNDQLVQLLLDHNADPNVQNGRGITALMSSTGNSKVFQMLLDHGADVHAVSFENFTPMHFAAVAGNKKVVEILIEKDKDQMLHMDRDGEHPLMLASRYGHAAVVKLLLKANAEPNNQDPILGWTALQGASAFGHTDVVKLLLQEKAKPDIQNYGVRSTALQVACKSGYKDVVKLLLEAQADPNIPDNKGQTALIQACAHGHMKIVSELLPHHMKQPGPNLEDSEGWTALEVTRFGNRKIVKLDLNHQDDNGRTALMWACKEGHTAIVAELLRAHPDRNLKDKDGRTASELAALNGNGDICELLQAQTADCVIENEVLPKQNLILTKKHDNDG